MFKVNGLTRGTCDANENHADRNCYEVEDLLTHQHLRFCPKCFEAHVALRSKGTKSGPPPNGQPPAPHEPG